MRSRRTHRKRHMLEFFGTTLGCLCCEKRGDSEECRKRIEQEMVVKLLTQRQRNRRAALMTQDLILTKQVRLDSHEPAQDLVAQITYYSVQSVCETMIDLTNDAMAWSCKFPVAELETGKTLDDDTSIIVDASSNEISELPRETHSV